MRTYRVAWTRSVTGAEDLIRFQGAIQGLRTMMHGYEYHLRGG